MSTISLNAEIKAAKERLFDYRNPGPRIVRDGWHVNMEAITRKEIKALQAKVRRVKKEGKE